MNQKNENLEQLLRQFVNEAQARDMADDIRQVDILFENFPAPSAAGETIETIHHNVRRQLELNQRLHTKLRYFSAAAVAVILLAGMFILRSDFKRMNDMHPLQVAGANEFWSELNSFETSMADIDSQISNLSETINTMDSGAFEPFNPLKLDITELDKIESLTDSTEFWKG